MVWGGLQSLARLLALSCIIMRSLHHTTVAQQTHKVMGRGGQVSFGGWKMLPLGSAVWSRGGGGPSSPSPRPPATPSSWSPPPRTACPGCWRRAEGARWRRFGCGGFGSPPPLASSRRAHTRWHATAATHTGRLRPGGLWWLQPSRPLQVPPSPPIRPPDPPTPHQAPSPTDTTTPHPAAIPAPTVH